MDEEVLAALVRGDEAEALVVVEPLDGSGCHAFLHGSCCNCVRGEFPARQLLLTYTGRYDPPCADEPTTVPGVRGARDGVLSRVVARSPSGRRGCSRGSGAADGAAPGRSGRSTRARAPASTAGPARSGRRGSRTPRRPPP